MVVACRGYTHPWYWLHRILSRLTELDMGWQWLNIPAHFMFGSRGSNVDSIDLLKQDGQRYLPDLKPPLK
jgi:hypothetical protein